MPDESEEIKNLFGFVAPTTSQLSTISTWATKALELQAEIEVIEAHLKHLNKELAQIEEVDLPNALMAAGSSDFTTTNGGTIKLKDVIQGGLSKNDEQRKFTMDWVEDNGGKENIKDHFEIDFTKGDFSRAI